MYANNFEQLRHNDAAKPLKPNSTGHEGVRIKYFKKSNDEVITRNERI